MVDGDDPEARLDALPREPARERRAPEGARADRIRALNDRFRGSPQPDLGKIMVTREVSGIGQAQIVLLITRISVYRRFDTKTDPTGLHESGVLEQAGRCYRWRIDYFDLAYAGPASDPADPQACRRVLTVMGPEG